MGDDLPVSAGISAVGSIASAGIGAWGASNAASAQSAAAQAALQFQKKIYKDAKGNLGSWIDMGKSAVTSLSDLYGLGKNGTQGMSDAFNAFTNLPSYQFPFQQGLRALDHSLNAQGRTQSGAEAKETQQFGQGLASTYMMQNYVNPLMHFSDVGADSSKALGSIGVGVGQQVGQSYGNLGAAQASGYVGTANALSGGIGNLTNSLSMYSLMSRSSPNFNSSYANAPQFNSVGGGQAASAQQPFGAAYAPGGFNYNYG